MGFIIDVEKLNNTDYLLSGEQQNIDNFKFICNHFSFISRCLDRAKFCLDATRIEEKDNFDYFFESSYLSREGKKLIIKEFGFL